MWGKLFDVAPKLNKQFITMYDILLVAIEKKKSCQHSGGVRGQEE